VDRVQGWKVGEKKEASQSYVKQKLNLLTETRNEGCGFTVIAK